ncbi:MAG: class I SAM-dependent methyltransferase [Lachnospiraceae bacterium]|jgi:SAM-dependent methyltransferase|nr:class I SAM-dependent methyltransferase [Lachnospiraceae bacterium]
MATLHTEFSTFVIDENKISAFDKKTYSYIKKYGDIPYDPVIAEETDWQIFYNLTELRKGILSWYDFPADARVLEAGAAFGTLTGCLCRKCAHVTATDRSLYRARAIAARYEDMDNLDIYAGEVTDIVFPEAFDCIILIGLLERAGKGSADVRPYADYLTAMRKWLKPGGRILIAVENRFGLRYFCGEAEPHTRRPFDGINHYPGGAAGYSFSRKEIEDIVKAAGFGHHRFFYPLPDYKLPQLIYTDDWLPGENLRERLIPYYRRGDTLVASERELYDDIIENGVFPFFANSFLIECSIEGHWSEAEGKTALNKIKASDRTVEDIKVQGTKVQDTKGQKASGQILYAAVSTDRGMERGFATVIRANGRVHKTPLYEQGRCSLRKAYENILDLQAHGIPVVEHKLLPGDILELPFVSWPTLSDYIKEIMQGNTEEFLQLIDRIYEYILLSSEEVPEEDNALPAALGLCMPCGRPETAEEGNPVQSNQAQSNKVEGNPVQNSWAQSNKVEDNLVQSNQIHSNRGDLVKGKFGPILRRAYMELIPLNCFYNPATEDFLYFDQEFVRENYPAKYVLFRAIHYIYCFTPNAERYYPKQKLLEKYGLEDTWEIYLKEETRFLDEVRNRERYKQFYERTQIDRRRIVENVSKLGN